MDDRAEWEILDDEDKVAIGRENNQLRSSAAMKQRAAPHLRWNLDRDICSVGKEIQAEAANYDDQSVSSNCSVCSDNYVFVLSEPEIMNNAASDSLPDSLLPTRPDPPTMTVIYSYDLCLAQTRDVDDAISYARSLGKPSLALKQALSHRRDVRRHGLDQLVDEYFVALLRMQAFDEEKPLSFSRLKIAVGSVPILLGGDPRMWQRWIFMFGNIPGGIFLIREKIPVRDPVLPAFVFEMSLERMMEEILSSSDKERPSVNEAKEDPQIEASLLGEKMADLFLETLRSWGPTSAIRRWIQLHRYCAQNQQWGLAWHSPSGSSAVIPLIRQAEKDLQRRISQTAFGVLADNPASPAQNTSMRQYIDSPEDSLFDVENLISRLAARLQPDSADNSGNLSVSNTSSNIILFGKMEGISTVIIESMAELELMRERFDRALGYYLAIGNHFMADSLSSIEQTAVSSVNSFCRSIAITTGVEQKFDSIKYSHVLALIELHNLSHILLERNIFLDDEDDSSEVASPIVALIMIVGLSRVGRFLIDNCSPPEGTVTPIGSERRSLSSNLPFDVIAKQLKSRPKILYWFLFQVFLHKPDIYVKFPTTTVPPPVITELHRQQFYLFVDYADQDDTSNEDAQSPAELISHRETPFMAFLRDALKHSNTGSAIKAENVRERLEACRSGNDDSPTFARELAFVIEHFGSGTIEDAQDVLQLYLRGAKNLYMAVAFAERSQHSTLLWDMLVEHCTTPDPNSATNQIPGALFGSLLEAAAHTGSDLGALVSRIPEGMSIEGLRPKLIAAITDYRYKVKIHEQVDSLLIEDKISVLRQLSHVSRRGEKMECEAGIENSIEKSSAESSPVSSLELLKSQRSKVPSSHNSRVFSLPIR